MDDVELETVQGMGEIHTPPSLREAVFLRADIEDREQQIRVLQAEALAQVADQVAALRAEAEGLQRKHDRILAECVAAGHMDEGRFIIKVKAKTTRTVNVERFRVAFPVEFADLAMIPVLKAEAVIGKKRLTPYCDLTRGPETYEVGFRSIEEGAG